MATKLDTRSTKNSGRAPAGKRMTFDRGQAKAEGSGLPLKTADVDRLTKSGVKE